MSEVILFTDGSVHPQSKVGFGACLKIEGNTSVKAVSPQVTVRRFDQTSSTQLELQTILWALADPALQNRQVKVYTDSQNTVGLFNRRLAFESSQYHTRSGKVVRHKELYQEFFNLTDRLDCEFIKIKGHKKSHLKDELDELFTLVDRASRDALRDYLAKEKK